MSDLTQALADFQFGMDHHGGVFNEDLRVLDGVDPQAWSLVEDNAEAVTAAARRVAEAPEVWWCENHQELGEDDKTCTWAWENGLSIRFCRMVRKLLVDPDNL